MCNHPTQMSVSLNVSLSDHICLLNVAECKPGLADSPQTGRYGDIMGFALAHFSLAVLECVFGDIMEIRGRLGASEAISSSVLY